MKKSNFALRLQPSLMEKRMLRGAYEAAVFLLMNHQPPSDGRPPGHRRLRAPRARDAEDVPVMTISPQPLAGARWETVFLLEGALRQTQVPASR